MLESLLYLLYAVAGTSSAALAKAGIARARDGDWFGAAMRLVTACVAIGLNLAAFFLLLDKSDLSIVEPVGVGCNLMVSAVIAVSVFRERIDGWKAAGFGLITIGVVLLAGHWS